jgi:hypothetical protein
MSVSLFGVLSGRWPVRGFFFSSNRRERWWNGDRIRKRYADGKKRTQVYFSMDKKLEKVQGLRNMSFLKQPQSGRLG